jgi:hypothetical protein
VSIADCLLTCLEDLPPSFFALHFGLGLFGLRLEVRQIFDGNFHFRPARCVGQDSILFRTFFLFRKLTKLLRFDVYEPHIGSENVLGVLEREVLLKN